MILTRIRSVKQPIYTEKAYNKLKCIVTFLSVNNIKSRSRTKCMARSYLTFFDYSCAKCDRMPSNVIAASNIVFKRENVFTI